MSDSMHEELTDRRPLLSAKGLTMTYGGALVLDEFVLDLLPGEIHGLAGLNGAGKSTVIKLLSGVIQPTRGTIEMPDRGPVTIASPAAAQDLGIGVVHQELPLFPNLTASENTVVGLERRPLWARRRAVAAVGTYEGTSRRFTGPPPAGAKLGDQGLYAWQIVAIVRAIASNVRVLILDEPTSSLSTSERASLHQQLHELQAQGIAILYVSHFLDDLLEACDRVTVLRDGATVRSAAASAFTSSILLADMMGPQEAAVTGATSSHAPVLPYSAPGGLEVQSLRAGHAVDVSFEARRGERVGLYGLEDSGAREVLEALAGLRQRSGVVRWDGAPVPPQVPRAISTGVALVTGDRKRAVIPGWTVARNHALPRLAQKSLWRRPGRETDATLTDSIELLSIKAAPADTMAALSGGNQQKVLLGRWLARDVHCLLLDEPTRGVDVAGRAAIHRGLEDLAASGTTLLLNSTDPQEIVELCTRALVFANGRLVADVEGGELNTVDLERLVRDRSRHHVTKESA